ncbi:hypothetical protein ACHWQZ_G013897 [Mnemiopsis leidyi]
MKSLLDEVKTTVLGEIQALKEEMDLYKQQLQLLTKEKEAPAPIAECTVPPYGLFKPTPCGVPQQQLIQRVPENYPIQAHGLPIPPSAPLDDFQACLSALDGYTDGKDDYDLCLLGDFNFPGLTWDPPMSQTATPSSDLLEAFINTHLLSQYILQPTRQGNILDLFFSNSSSLATHVDVQPTRMSDHDIIEIYLSYNPCQPNINAPPLFDAASFRRLNFGKADFTAISAEIETTDWVEKLETCGVEGFPDSFRNSLLSICQKHCPPKLPPRRQSSRILRILSRKKRRLQAQLNKAKIPDKPPVRGYTTSNSNSLLEWRKDPTLLEVWGGQDI